MLQFYKTEFHYKDDTIPFTQELYVKNLPKVNEIFSYTEDMFDLMDNTDKRRFTQGFRFKIGDYYVLDKINYPGKDYNVDYTFFLIEELDNGKSAFIDLKDIAQ